MSLDQLNKGAKIIETIENYARADEDDLKVVELDGGIHFFYTEEEFWRAISTAPEKYIGKRISLIQFVVSRWIARVPGFFWTTSAEIIRRHSDEDIAIVSEEWIKFKPPGKSKKVLGGIGSILLPPTDDGKTLMSVSSSSNASLGIPILVFPDVIEELNIKQGDVVSIKNATWLPLNAEWSSRFPTTNEVPRGYLVIDNTNKIEKYNEGLPTIYHPFSIMEYEFKDALLYDFVYLAVDSKTKNAKKEIEKFFESYRLENDRFGKYLINPNLIEPLFETQYTCPADLRSSSEKAKLDLLYQRVRGAYFDNVSLDQLIQSVSENYQSSYSVKRLAQSIQIRPALLADDNAASMVAQLIALCIDRNKTEELIDRVLFEYPEIFK